MRLWGCILEFVSRGSFIWSLFWDHSHLLWGYVGPYFNFHSFFGSLLGIIPKKCPYLTFSYWYLNAIKHWTAVPNKQRSPDEKVNNAFVPFANSIATRSCTSNGLLIVRRTIKKVYKRYKIEKSESWQVIIDSTTHTIDLKKVHQTGFVIYGAILHWTW